VCNVISSGSLRRRKRNKFSSSFEEKEREINAEIIGQFNWLNPIVSELSPNPKKKTFLSWDFENME